MADGIRHSRCYGTPPNHGQAGQPPAQRRSAAYRTAQPPPARTEQRRIELHGGRRKTRCRLPEHRARPSRSVSGGREKTRRAAGQCGQAGGLSRFGFRHGQRIIRHSAAHVVRHCRANRTRRFGLGKRQTGSRPEPRLPQYTDGAQAAARGQYHADTDAGCRRHPQKHATGGRNAGRRAVLGGQAA